MSESPDQVKTIFGQAIEFVSPVERARYLDGACGENAALRAEVDQLLAAMDEAGDFLVAPARDAALTLALPNQEKAGSQIGPYKLLQVLGEGGMGTVFMAEQKEPVKRRVALKIIKPGMDTQQVIARFEAERQALALMDHPNIARVLDAGTTESGRPFFVMELVKGVSLSQYCDEQHLTPRQRLELFVPICQAVQHAHQKGIIHRDLKPSNILVAEYDHQPVPKIIDFGVAKAVSQTLTEKTMFTQYGQIVGTLEYMSPEQAKLNQLDIDTRSDIYSLGVILYELLTGTTPFDRRRLRSAAFEEMLRIIREEEPPRPSTRVSTFDTLASIAANRRMEPQKLGRMLRGELDWIVMKSLEKDRARRYETANGLAADLLRYLADEPVVACPPSSGYRFRKFVHRHRTVLMVACLAMLVLLVFMGSVGWLVRDRISREQEIARERSEQEAKIARDRTAQQALNEQFVTRALDLSLEYLRERKWQQALTEARRADAALASGPASDELRERVTIVLADLQMLLRLGELFAVAPESAVAYSPSARLEAYAQAFREYGIDLDLLKADQAAELIKRREIRLELAIGLTAAILREIPKDRADDDVWARRRKLLAVVTASDPDPWRTRVREMFEQGDREGIIQLAQAPEAAEQPEDSISVLGQALMNLKAWREAATVLTPAQLRHPDDYRLNYLLGAALRLSARPVEAMRYDQAAVALRPSSPGTINVLAADLIDQGRSEEAIPILRNAIAAGGPTWKYAGAHVYLGRLLEAKGNREEAITCFRTAIEREPNSPLPHFHLGQALEKQGKGEESKACFARIAELLPKADAYTLRNLGVRLLQHGKHQEAIDALRASIRLNPNDVQVHRNLAIALLERGELEPAFEESCAASKLSPGDVGVWNTRALVAIRIGSYADARESCERAQKLAPTSPSANNNLAWLLATCPDVNLRDPARAVQLARAAVEPARQYAAYFNTLGVSQYRAGDYVSAYESLQASQAIMGDVAIDLFFKAMCCWQLNRKDEALELFGKGAKCMDQQANQDPELVKFRAEAALLLGLEDTK